MHMWCFPAEDKPRLAALHAEDLLEPGQGGDDGAAAATGDGLWPDG